ncbi:MAG: type II secretion system F family protein [Sporichthyaceae bacterium]|nr:type II secretion system F family protein [Sporichthyaceae bacterium]
MSIPTQALAAVLGGGIGYGVYLIANDVVPLAADRIRAGTTRAGTGRNTARLAGAAAAAVVMLAVTGWVAGAVLGAAAAWLLPSLIGRDHHGQARIARIEAVAGWAEMLRDTLGAAAGLEQAIHATAPIAPAPIRDQVQALSAHLHAGGRLQPGLLVFASDLGEDTGDLVAAALLLTAGDQAGNLAGQLDTLARLARDHAGLRLRIAAGRARIRTAARLITGVTLTILVALVLLNRAYLSPYDSAVGQLVLLAAGGCFAAAYHWLARIGADPAPRSILAPATPTGAEPGQVTR